MRHVKDISSFHNHHLGVMNHCLGRHKHDRNSYNPLPKLFVEVKLRRPSIHQKVPSPLKPHHSQSSGLLNLYFACLSLQPLTTKPLQCPGFTILQIRSAPPTESPSLIWTLLTFPACGAEMTISYSRVSKRQKTCHGVNSPSSWH